MVELYLDIVSMRLMHYLPSCPAIYNKQEYFTREWRATEETDENSPLETRRTEMLSKQLMRIVVNKEIVYFKCIIASIMMNLFHYIQKKKKKNY